MEIIGNLSGIFQQFKTQVNLINWQLKNTVFPQIEADGGGVFPFISKSIFFFKNQALVTLVPLPRTNFMQKKKKVVNGLREKGQTDQRTPDKGDYQDHNWKP